MDHELPHPAVPFSPPGRGRTSEDDDGVVGARLQQLDLEAGFVAVEIHVDAGVVEFPPEEGEQHVPHAELLQLLLAVHLGDPDHAAAVDADLGENRGGNGWRG